MRTPPSPMPAPGQTPFAQGFQAVCTIWPSGVSMPLLTVEVRVRFKSFDMHFPFIPFIDDGMVTAEAESRVDYVPSQPETCN